MLRKLFIALAFLALVSFSYAEEKITITTYYPSPYGSYREVRAQRMAIGDNYIQNVPYTWEETDGDGGEIDYRTDLVVEGDVGIGTTTPATELEVVGNISVGHYRTDSVRTIGTWGDAFELMNSGMFIRNFADGNSNLWFYTSTPSVSSPRLAITPEGDVGIGTTTPAQKLDVQGGYIRTSNIDSAAANTAFLEGATNEGYVGSLGSQPFYIGNSENWKTMTVDNGLVGIGTSPSGALLDVNGQVRIRGGSPAAGRVLTSDDANGVASWQDVGRTLVGYEVIDVTNSETYQRTYTGLVKITFNFVGLEGSNANIGWFFYVDGALKHYWQGGVNYVVMPSPSYIYFLEANGPFSVRMYWWSSSSAMTSPLHQIILEYYK